MIPYPEKTFVYDFATYIRTPQNMRSNNPQNPK